MMKATSTQRRVLVTGIGTVSHSAVGKDAFWAGALGHHADSRAGFSTAGIYTAAHSPVTLASLRIKTKQPWSDIRSTVFATKAAELALEDAGLSSDEENKSTYGVVCGTSHACLSIAAKVDRMVLQQGARYCDPMLFPDTGMNSPSCRVSQVLGLQGPNATLANGQTSGLDAIAYGSRHIRDGSAKVVLAGGVEELSVEALRTLQQLGLIEVDVAMDLMSQLGKDLPLSPAEGAAFLVLEEYEHAMERGAGVLAEVGRFHSRCSLKSARRFQGLSPILSTLLCLALNNRTGKNDAGVLYANADLSPEGERCEARALAAAEMVGTNMAIAEVKSLTGDTLGASGAFSAAACVLSLATGLVPPSNNMVTSTLLGARHRANQLDPGFGLVTAFGRNGWCGVLSLDKLFAGDRSLPKDLANTESAS